MVPYSQEKSRFRGLIQQLAMNAEFIRIQSAIAGS